MIEGLTIKTEPSFSVSIYMAGDIDTAKQALRHEVLREGLCVTVTPTSFIYSGGEEQGFVVGLVNYPRFPSEPEQIKDRADAIADLLIEACAQWSALVVTPPLTEWRTRRAL